MNKTKTKFGKDFIMVIIGQIISLFGNQILRFALPLYLLDQTNSPALFGLVSACAFIPMILMSPVGGILADRNNKRNIMVILDFSTSALILVFTILLGRVDLVVLLMITMMILYGIQGTYQPAVQASIPALVDTDNIMAANAAVNLVASFSGLIGPVAGAALYAKFGIRPVLFVGIGCFFASAVMEIFIKIPFKKQQSSGSILNTVVSDMKDSFRYMINDQPKVWKVCLIVAAINMFMSALIIIGLPVIVTKTLDFSEETGKLLYGYAEGALALGSPAGGILAGVLSRKLNADKSYTLLYLCTLTFVPIAVVLALNVPAIVTYAVIVVCCFFMLLAATLFSIQMVAYLQMLSPSHLVGKIIAVAMSIGMCATPLGQALYGALFEGLKENIYIIFIGVSVVGIVISFISKFVFKGMNKLLEECTIKITEENQEKMCG